MKNKKRVVFGVCAVFAMICVINSVSCNKKREECALQLFHIIDGSMFGLVVFAQLWPLYIVDNIYFFVCQTPIHNRFRPEAGGGIVHLGTVTMMVALVLNVAIVLCVAIFVMKRVIYHILTPAPPDIAATRLYKQLL